MTVTRDHDAWRAVVQRLGDEPEQLTTDELARLADAHWWLSDIPASIRVDEILHRRLVAEGRPADAAGRALRLCLEWGTRGDITLAGAWLSTAQRLLRDQPTCVQHGYVAYTVASTDLDFRDEPATAAATAVELAEMARTYADRTLECFALVLEGMAAVRSGDIDGFAALDEAMIPVLGGQVDPMWGGDIYCSVIHLCEALGDLARMRSWTDALASWASPLSETFMFAAVTRVHQLQLLRAEGDWDVVEREMGERSDGLSDAHGWLAAAGFYELGEVHRLRGRPGDARAAYERTRTLGLDPQPGEALLLHAEGRTAEALAALRFALAEQGRLERARTIPAAVAIALAAGDAPFAESLAAELERTASFFGTPGLLAGAASARADLLAAAGRHAEALTQLERAAQIYREQRHRHAMASVHESMAAASRHLGDTDRADAEVATARAIYARLGAAADLARIDTSARPAGLTAREVEVLVQVSAGLTNKQVAQALVISDKTVSRHLASIFTKTGVASRTAAAAWAHEHGIS
jgi:DNA-binding CsgD family transcriptional regulator